MTKLHCKKQNVNYNFCSACLHVEKEEEKQGEDEYGYVVWKWLVCGHVGMAEVRLVAALIVRTRRRKRRIRLADEEKTRRLIFFRTLHFNFLSFNTRNPLIFIEDGRETFYFYRKSILALDLSGKNPNR